MNAFEHRRQAGSLPHGARQAAVLVGVLVCLMVVTLIVAALLRTVLVDQRQARVVQQKLQAFWLAESATNRALAALRRSSECRGETWRIDSNLMDGKNDAKVDIRVEPVGPLEKHKVRLSIEAYFPADSMRRAGHRKQLVTVVQQPAGSP